MYNFVQLYLYVLSFLLRFLLCYSGVLIFLILWLPFSDTSVIQSEVEKAVMMPSMHTRLRHERMPLHVCLGARGKCVLE